MRPVQPFTLSTAARALETMPDRELLAASQTLSTIAFTRLAADGLCDRTTARLLSRHHGELVLIGAATGLSLDLLSDDASVHGELARRANVTLARFRIQPEQPSSSNVTP